MQTIRRIVSLWFFVGLSTLLSAVFAQAPQPGMVEECDPYGRRWVWQAVNPCEIPIDHRTYRPPSGEPREKFFARLMQGTPVAERHGYTWEHYGAGWLWEWSLDAASTPPPPSNTPPAQGIWMKTGHAYKDQYYVVRLVLGIVQMANGEPKYHLERISAPSCGDLGYWAVQQLSAAQYQEVASDPSAWGCPEQ